MNSCSGARKSSVPLEALGEKAACLSVSRGHLPSLACAPLSAAGAVTFASIFLAVADPPACLPPRGTCVVTLDPSPHFSHICRGPFHHCGDGTAVGQDRDVPWPPQATTFLSFSTCWLSAPAFSFVSTTFLLNEYFKANLRIYHFTCKYLATVPSSPRNPA